MIIYVLDSYHDLVSLVAFLLHEFFAFFFEVEQTQQPIARLVLLWSDRRMFWCLSLRLFCVFDGCFSVFVCEGLQCLCYVFFREVAEPDDGSNETSCYSCICVCVSCFFDDPIHPFLEQVGIDGFFLLS
jgi:hypothetical protein